MLRKIIREEVKNMNEVDPTAAAQFSAGLSSSLGAGLSGGDVLNLLLSAVGAGTVAHMLTPEIKAGVELAKKMLGSKAKPATKDNKLSEMKTLIREGALDPKVVEAILQAVAAMATAGVGAGVLSSYLEDVAKKLNLKPNPEEKFFGEQL